MKKTFIFTLLAACYASTCLAQFSGNSGYYRLQNASSKRYARIVDDKASSPNISSTSNIELYAINTVAGFNNVVSDPATIVYIENAGSSNYSLKAMGMDTYKLIERYLKIQQSKATSGAYVVYGSYDGIAKYLYEAYNKNHGFYYMSSYTKNSDGTARSRDWNIIPVTQAEGQYFGIKPELSIGGKYYTTLYTSFPYQLGEGMKAYYVTRFMVGSDIASQYAELTEITEKIVPAKSPVIIECSSNDPAKNKVTLLESGPSRYLRNLLDGVYFCNVIRWTDDGQIDTTHPNWNTTAYDPNTMRVLGNVNGKLGLVKASNMTYLPACKAYLEVPTTATGTSGTGEITLVDPETYTAGIQSITTDDRQEMQGIYTLTGIKVDGKDTTEGLPAGVYIVNGKKVVQK